MNPNQIPEYMEPKIQTQEARRTMKLAHKLVKHSRKRREGTRLPGQTQKD